MTDWNKRVLTTSPFRGICHMIVCCVKDASDKEILEHCNTENPSGTTAGWAEVIRKGKEYQNPVPCDEKPERLHIMVEC